MSDIENMPLRSDHAPEASISGSKTSALDPGNRAQKGWYGVPTNVPRINAAGTPVIIGPAPVPVIAPTVPPPTVYNPGPSGGDG